MTRPRVLVADTHDASRRALAGLLAECGLSVTEALDGFEGLHRARSQRPDLVIADLWSFFGAAQQMIRRLRTDPETRHVPVLLLTTGLPPGPENALLREQCEGCLEKPCTPERLLGEVNRILALAGGGIPVAGPV